MIEIATNGVFEENRKKKHGRDADYEERILLSTSRGIKAMETDL